jgi:hypothetical protein
MGRSPGPGRSGAEYRRVRAYAASG